MRSFLVLLFLLTASSATAACYSWPLREVGGRVVYDGDSVYVSVPQVPPELQDMSVRIRGIDTPELRARCDSERYRATAARDYLDHLLRRARAVTFCEPSWDKYGGRVGADVKVNGTRVADLMVQNGFARPYTGGKRAGWCD